MPTAPDALLFDLDGTIVDSRVPYTRSMNHALASVGLPTHAPEDLYQYLGPPIHETLTEHLGVPTELVEPIVALYRQRYAEFGLQESTVFEGIPELLRDLHGGVPLAIATSKVRVIVGPLLEHFGLLQLFDFVGAPSPEAINESKAQTIASALVGLGGPKRPVMIGDRFYDVEGAREHGIPTVGVLWGVGGEEELRAAGAQWLVSQPGEIPRVLGLE
jgi:phosphoglycolate phosphatase